MLVNVSEIVGIFVQLVKENAWLSPHDEEHFGHDDNLLSWKVVLFNRLSQDSLRLAIGV